MNEFVFAMVYYFLVLGNTVLHLLMMMKYEIYHYASSCKRFKPCFRVHPLVCTATLVTGARGHASAAADCSPGGRGSGSDRWGPWHHPGVAHSGESPRRQSVSET